MFSLQFFVGWWFIIDASTEHGGGVNFAHHLCGILGTISFIMINSVDLVGGAWNTDPESHSINFNVFAER